MESKFAMLRSGGENEYKGSFYVVLCTVYCCEKEEEGAAKMRWKGIKKMFCVWRGYALS